VYKAEFIFNPAKYFYIHIMWIIKEIRKNNNERVVERSGNDEAISFQGVVKTAGS
jgi:hypothetical protein